MNIQVYVEVSDRKEVENVPGLHAQLLFRFEGLIETYALVGVVTLTEEGEIGEVTLVFDALALSNEVGRVLIMAACESCWNAVVVGGMALAGSEWQPLEQWFSRCHVSRSADGVAGRTGGQFGSHQNRSEP